MNDQRRFVWKSGRLANSPLSEFWSPTLTAKDPAIPSLPLESQPDGPAGEVVPYQPHYGRAPIMAQ
jgi:hypothetical protein